MSTIKTRNKSNCRPDDEDDVVQVTVVHEKEEIIRAILNGDETPPIRKKAKRKRPVPAAADRSAATATTTTKLTNIKQTTSLPRRLTLSTTWDIDHDLTLQAFQHSRHSLRLSTSSIAAMTGFHPYTNVAKLFMDLVYQGPIGQQLLQRDAKLLGLEMISEQEALRQIAQKAGKDVLHALLHSMDVSRGKVKVKSIQEANILQNNIIHKVQENTKITQGERKILQEATRYNINTGFGKDHEENALDLYEKQCGWEVTCRNEDLKYWDFELKEEGHAVPIENTRGDTVESSTPSPELNHNGNQNVPTTPAAAAAVSAQERARKKSSKPFFSIVGVVDGIREELYHTGASKNDQEDNGGDWALRQVVVECKHRMKKAFVPPPIYDQIQLAIYCRMYGTTEGEIVQVVRSHHSNHPDEKTCNAPLQQPPPPPKDPKEKDNCSKISITVNRVSLDDEIMKHGEHWDNTILPRLTSFVKGVYNVRSCDDKRYRMVQAAAIASSGGEERPWWQIVLDECPWLTECDIACFR